MADGNSSGSEQLGDRLAFFEELYADAQATTRLSQWDMKFLDSLNERVTVYRDRTYLSARQLEVLKRIETTLYG